MYMLKGIVEAPKRKGINRVDHRNLENAKMTQVIVKRTSRSAKDTSRMLD